MFINIKIFLLKTTTEKHTDELREKTKRSTAENHQIKSVINDNSDGKILKTDQI